MRKRRTPLRNRMRKILPEWRYVLHISRGSKMNELNSRWADHTSIKRTREKGRESEKILTSNFPDPFPRSTEENERGTLAFVRIRDCFISRWMKRDPCIMMHSYFTSCCWSWLLNKWANILRLFDTLSNAMNRVFIQMRNSMKCAI